MKFGFCHTLAALILISNSWINVGAQELNLDVIAEVWSLRQKQINEIKNQVGTAHSDAAILDILRSFNEEREIHKNTYLVIQTLGLKNSAIRYSLTDFETESILAAVQDDEVRAEAREILIRENLLHAPLLTISEDLFLGSRPAHEVAGTPVVIANEELRRDVYAYWLNECGTPKIPGAKTYGPIELESIPNGVSQKDLSLMKTVSDFRERINQTSEDPNQYYGIVLGRTDMRDTRFKDSGIVHLFRNERNAVKAVHIVSFRKDADNLVVKNSCGPRFVIFIHREDLPLFKRSDFQNEVIVIPEGELRLDIDREDLFHPNDTDANEGKHGRKESPAKRGNEK